MTCCCLETTLVLRGEVQPTGVVQRWEETVKSVLNKKQCIHAYTVFYHTDVLSFLLNLFFLWILCKTGDDDDDDDDDTGPGTISSGASTALGHINRHSVSES